MNFKFIKRPFFILIVLVYVAFLTGIYLRNKVNITTFVDTLSVAQLSFGILLFAIFITILIFFLTKYGVIPSSELDTAFVKLVENYKLENSKLSNRIEKLSLEIKTKTEEIEKYKSLLNENDLTSFIKTVPHQKIYLSTIDKKIKSVTKSLLICNTHWDHTLSHEIAQLKDRCDVKIITKQKNSGSKEHEEAYTYLKKIFREEMRDNRMLHCRLIIIDNCELIVGSADLDANGMTNEFQAGVLCRNQNVVDDAVNFFNYLWTANSDNK